MLAAWSRTPSLSQRAAILGAAILVALAAIVLVVKVFPEVLASTAGLAPKAKAEEVGRTRTAVLALLAGGIAVLGAVYTARTYSLNRRGQITDRFIRGIEQLGDRSLDVRVGGIYVLGSVAKESEREHRPVMETLAAFVRQHSLPCDQVNEAGRFPLDIQAAMIVLTSRNRAFDGDEFRPDHRRANLSYLRLEVGADLRRMNLSGVRLDHAHLRGADLRGAWLSGASLEYARLGRSRLGDAEVRAANLKHADLAECDLRGARLSGSMLLEANMNKADLRGADFAAWYGPDESGEIVDYIPAFLNTAGGADPAHLVGAIYDDATAWPNLPSEYDFDPEFRGATKV